MIKVTHILGNISSDEWLERSRTLSLEEIPLDQWMAQRHRMIAEGSRGNSYAIALERKTPLRDGDIIYCDNEKMAVVRLQLNDIMVIELGALSHLDPRSAVRLAVEIGHALGNQHWPAVVHEDKILVPLTTDRKVMQSVMRTHSFEHIAYAFRPASQIIPYLAPHEVRRLLGSSGQHIHTDNHHHVHR